MASDERDERALKLALNQSVFRDANERLNRIAHQQRFEKTQRVPFVCECPDPGCSEVVMLSLAEYEAIREHPARFLLVAGHEDDEEILERIIEVEQGYAVVEKVGAAGTEATRLDRRSGGG